MTHEVESTFDRISPWLILLPLLVLNIAMFVAWS